MNLVMDYLNGLLDASEQRMDAIGIPTIEKVRCPQCGGDGYVPIGPASERRCTQCCGHGYVNRERP